MTRIDFRKPILGFMLLSAIASWLLMQGDSNLSFSEVVSALNYFADNPNKFVVWNLRLPPIGAGIIGGGLLAIAGLIFQRVLRNTLATPDIIGISSVSALGAITASLFLFLPLFASYLFSVAFGFVGMFLGFWAAGKNDPKRWRLVLAGVAVSYLATGFTNYLLTATNVDKTRQLYGWLVGSTSFASLTDLWILLGSLPILLALVWIVQKPLASLEIGDQQSTALGFEANFWVRVTLGVGVFATGISTAAIGPIAFVSLTAPVITRYLFNNSSYLLVGMIGSLLVLIADAINQFGFGDLGLPTGITSGLVGAPVLLYLVLRQQRVGMVR